MSLEALALEYMNDKHIDNGCSCKRYKLSVQVWMAEPCRFERILITASCREVCRCVVCNASNFGTGKQNSFSCIRNRFQVGIGKLFCTSA